MGGFALRGRWLAGTLVVIVLAGVFVLAGLWQLDRLEQRRASNAVVEARRATPAAPLEVALAQAGGDPAAVAERPVTVTGRYDPGAQFLVQFRPLAGQPGQHVLTPLVRPDGTAVVVNRGWVPASGPDTPLPDGSDPPVGEVTVTGVALPGEARAGLGPEESTAAARGILPRVDLDAIEARVPYPLAPVFVQLQEQSPPQASGFPQPVPLSDLGAGPHLSYAIQWFAFAAIALVGWPLLLRRAARDRGPGPPRSEATPVAASLD